MLEGSATPAEGNHGYNGPIDVELPKVLERDAQVLLQAAEELNVRVKLASRNHL